jgi:arylsulfatase A-like enzyme
MNFLIVAIDSLRADRIRAGRSGPPQTPAIDQLLGRGVAFTQAVTACNVTTPSFTSLLTSRFIPGHGVHSLHGCRLPQHVPSLVEEFERGGYFTFAEVTGPLVEFIGLKRGFKDYHYRSETAHLATEWGDEFLRKVSARQIPEPWFGLLHLWEAHGPYFVPEEFNSPAYGNTKYDRAISALDPQIGKLVAKLPPDTVMVILGDHGENLPFDRDLRVGARLCQPLHKRLGWLWESLVLREYSSVYRPEDTRPKARLARWLARTMSRVVHRPTRTEYYRRWVPGHGESLYDEVVRVPLVFVGPGLSPATIPTQVRSVDVMPTLLDLAGLAVLPTDSPIDGQSLVPVIRGQNTEHRLAYFQTGGGNLPDPCLWMRGVRTPEYKFTYTPNAPAEHQLVELYDLKADPRETRNIVDRAPEVAAGFREECEKIANRPAPVAVPEDSLTEEEEAVLADRLRQLGYLE